MLISRGLGPKAPVHSLKEVIEFNEKNHDKEMPYFRAGSIDQSRSEGPVDRESLPGSAARSTRTCRANRESTLSWQKNKLDALIAPTGGPPWPTDWVNGDHFTGGYSTASAVAGYPHITVPAGYVFGLPVGHFVLCLGLQ